MQFVPGKQNKEFPIYNPTTEEKICSVSEALEEDVDAAVEAAQAAFPEWSSRSAAARAGALFKLSELIHKNATELARLDAICMGK